MNRDRLYFDKLAHAYGIFMQGGDDVPYLEQELAASFVAESQARVCAVGDGVGGTIMASSIE